MNGIMDSKICALLKNIKHNIALVLSTSFALCMFLTRNTSLLLILCAIEGAVLLLSAWNMAKPPMRQNAVTRITAVITALPILMAGTHTMQNRWAESDKLDTVSEMLGMGRQRVLMLAAAILALLGFYAVYTLANWLQAVLLARLNREGLTADGIHMENCLFAISAAAFFAMNTEPAESHILAGMVAAAFVVSAALHTTSLWKAAQKQPLLIRTVSLLSAFGICMCVIPDKNLQYALGPGVVLLRIAACYFPYICLVGFWVNFKKLGVNAALKKLSRAERAVYAALLVLSAVYVCKAFTASQAFYATSHAYDIIFTSDSPALVKGRVYIDLVNSQNDLRQPLFALFAMPFMGIPYLLITILNLPVSASAILLDLVQILLLLAANWMLADLMKLSDKNRICWMILSTLTYTFFLFALMMEQYIIGYFWLVLALYRMIQKNSEDGLTFLGAAGTMLTSAVLLPFVSKKSPAAQFRLWFEEVFHRGMEFVALIFAFGRFDVLYDLGKSLSDLMAFGGQTVTTAQKIFQYTYFIRNYFVSPKTQIIPNTFENISIQLVQPTAASITGILLLLFAAVSIVFNRKKQSTQMAALWLTFSALMLVGLGWGTMENGLILYSLYFGWPVLMLLFQLIVWIGERLHKSWFVPAVSAVAAAGLLAVNVPGVCQLMNFAITYYPA